MGHTHLSGNTVGIIRIQIIMPNLPAELESLVCSFLSIADLKTVRQANKRWADISGPFLFEELWIAQATFQNLEDISCYETLRSCVKKIVLNVSLVPVISPKAWKNKSRLKFLHMNPKELASKFQRYQSLYNEQQRFAGSDLGVVTMRRAVDKLPQLLCLAARTMHSTVRGMQYFVPPPNDSGYMGDIAVFNFVGGPVLLEEPGGASKFMRHTLTGLFQAQSGRKIKQFSPGVLSSTFITMPSQPMLGLALFEHLKALEVRILFFDDVDEHMSGLQSTLSKTLCLERLVLKIGHIRTRGRSDMLEGFRPSLPKLEHFELCGVHTTEHSLTSLLYHFIGSLRYLRLDMVSLVDQPLVQHSTSWSRMLSMFVSGEWDFARITLKDLSYFEPDKWSKTWLTNECLTAIQNTISHRAALPKNESYDDDRGVDRQTRPWLY